jgi:D-mannonate dehydratase
MMFRQWRGNLQNGVISCIYEALMFCQWYFLEASHLEGRGHLVELVRIFEKENPGLPMRVDHGKLMLGDAEKGYYPGYSFLDACSHWHRLKELWRQ